VTDLGWWVRVLKGEVTIARLRYFAGLALGKVAGGLRRLFSRGGEPGSRDDLASDLDRAADTRLVLAFSDGEPLATELRHEGVLDQIDRWPNIDLRELPGSDHTLRSPAAQAAAHRLLDGELDGLL
jgi:hypothetical protein